jgi:tetratricopeptide (TPR) repeat protein
MKRWIGALVVLAAFAPSAAHAQKAAAKDKAAAKPAAGEVRKDPKGVTGISPFWENVKKGDDLYVARDFDGAIAAYKDAITKEAQNPLGHYRIGEAHLAKGDLKEAEEAWVSALRFVGRDNVLKAKILFVLADLRERQKSYDDATDRWNAYETFAKQNTNAKAYPATATDRKKRVTEWKSLLEQYGAVKKRIEKRLKEADEKAKKSAK